MTYNYLFEIAAICILSIVFLDYRAKLRVYRVDGILFQITLACSLAASILDLISCILIENAGHVALLSNVAAAAIYFVVQAGMIYSIALFSFYYMNPELNRKSVGFWAITALFLTNLILAVGSPWTGWYFHFDSAGRYFQGPLTDWGYYFYYLNVLACLVYALRKRRHILKKDLKVAGWIAVFICVGVAFQHTFRDVLVVEFSVAMALLYIYMTLENPNDYQDKLTLCTNNYGFKILINAKSGTAKPFTVLFLDITKFRYVNAIYGIEMGNHLLQQIVVFLEESFSHNLVFRVNDDVFAVVFQGTQKNASGAVGLISERFDRPWMLPDGREALLHAVVITCEYPKHFCNHTELLELRNYMMNRVKTTHRGDVLHSDSSMAEQYRRREAVEQALRRALDQHRLKVWYQPIYNSATGTITAAEALSRLEDETLGSISPEEFIAVAEHNGLIIPLGFYVLEEVCTFIEKRVLTDKHSTLECIHVNMSMLQCAYPASNETYLEIIRRHRVPMSMIHFELTESTMVDSPDLVRRTMNDLICAGIHFALDDYGTGFSNISYLVQFPFDKVKFDKHMVWNFFENEAACTIMKNEFHIFHTIKKEIVVEGVEKEEQYERLKEHGIHLFQGYYFSKAVDGEECMAVVHRYEAETRLSERKEESITGEER